MAEETETRKAEHIKICLNEKAQTRKITTGFKDVSFIHKALPEIAKNKIDLSTHFLGHKFDSPIIIGAMTGGTKEAEKINSNIAKVVEKLNLGMGVGSQRAAIEDKNLQRSFAITRKMAPNAFLIANIGGVQLVHGYGIKQIKNAIQMIDADALAIHLNPLQEAIQPEGQTNFEGVLEKISIISEELDKPVLIKETGSGIAAQEAKKIEKAGVAAIDIGGAGGTSFAAVEYYRAIKQGKKIQEYLGDRFWDWGIPTIISLLETIKTVNIPVISSGGIRQGLDIAKSLALGASITSLSQPILEPALINCGKIEETLECIIEELKTTMFLVGATTIENLTGVPLIISGKASVWLEKRGYEVESYSKRGVN